jgi:hypothetical protein
MIAGCDQVASLDYKQIELVTISFMMQYWRVETLG